MKILFITSNRVGDAVLTTGLLAWLERTYPQAQFTIACGPYGADLFRAVPKLDRLIVMRKRRWNGHWFTLWRQCIATRWDLIVDLRNSAVSRLLRARRRASHGRSQGRHKVVENGAILNLSPPPAPYIWLTAEAKKFAAAVMPQDRFVLALGPAANWPPKQWPIAHFIDATHRLTQTGGLLENAVVLVIADKHEYAQVEPLLKRIPDERRIELIGGDLQQAAACLQRASLYIGNDSGLMHLAAALGTPTLGLFGPGYPDIYGPWGAKCAVVTTPESRDALLARLSSIKAREPNLMQSLSVEKVVEAAQNLLAKI